MKLSEFVDARYWALRHFLRSKLGKRWQYSLAKHLGLTGRHGPFLCPGHGIKRLDTLQRVEDFAISLGFRHDARLALLPRPPTIQASGPSAGWSETPETTAE